MSYVLTEAMKYTYENTKDTSADNTGVHQSEECLRVKSIVLKTSLDTLVTVAIPPAPPTHTHTPDPSPT